MADKGQNDDLHRIIVEECAKLHNYIVSLDKQISELRMHLESTKSEEALEALETEIEPMEITQAEVKKYILQEGLKVIFETEDGVRDCLKQCQMKFGFSEDPSEPSCSKDKEIFQEASKLEEEGDAHKSGLSPQSARSNLEMYANIEDSEQPMEELIHECKEQFKKDSGEPSCSKDKEIFQEVSKLEEEGDVHKFGLSPQAARPNLEVYPNIEDSEQQMEELILECKDGFKKDADSLKKSLLELLKMCKLLDHEEVRALEAIYLQAVRVGNRLSCLLIDFLFMMSRQKNLAEKIERLASALRCVAEEENSIFIVQLFNALKIVAMEFRRTKIIELTRPSLKRNLEAMENPESSSNRKTTPGELSDQQFLEPILYQLLDQFVRVAAHLESIVNHPRLPELQMPRKEALPMLQCCLRQCEKDMEWIMNCIRSIEAVAFSLLPRNDPKTREIRNIRRFHIQGGLDWLLRPR